jgi:3-hydroxybutyryl-CoA dehydratase
MNDTLVVGRFFEGAVLVSAMMVESFANATGDRNPIHFNDEAARLAGFPGRIAHGDLVVSLANVLIVEEFPGIMLVSRESRFRRAVPVDTPIVMTASVTEVAPSRGDDPNERLVRIDVKYRSKTGKQLAESIVTALYRPRAHVGA